MVKKLGQFDDYRVSDLENTHGFVNGLPKFEVENFDDNDGSTCQSVEEIMYLSARYVNTLPVIS